MFLLINKQPGPTSHDIVDTLRKITGIKKIGHAGTLDPFAEGLLIIAVERNSTKKIAEFVGMNKEYLATLQLGATSDTYDRTGEIEKNENNNMPSKEEIKKVLKKFVGKQEQIPPMFSAKKVGGKKLYKLARQGKKIERKPSQIEIYNIDLKKYNENKKQLEIKVSCSSGTYIRSLAYDIGRTLGTGAYLEKLVRTKIGKFKLEDTVKISELKSDNWQEFGWEK